ncbi:MAG: hypothetical protein CWE10_00355 [Symbiobacterium thermophilum]|uniref:UPF0342 protein CWE10_00355 n=2 Tax=Symbiobacterium thermophilum TaxID=2734 RepID=A0A953IAQ0_SYMTR|nr:hypothetical protein [Symbiobacterium thermophilum]
MSCTGCPWKGANPSGSPQAGASCPGCTPAAGWSPTGIPGERRASTSWTSPRRRRGGCCPTTPGRCSSTRTSRLTAPSCWSPGSAWRRPSSGRAAGSRPTSTSSSGSDGRRPGGRETAAAGENYRRGGGQKMVNVYDHAHSLARALKESQEYKSFQAAREKIKGKPAAEQMIADFHKRQMELQAEVLQGKELTQEQKEGLERLYNVLIQDLDIRDYLMAEQRLGTLLSDVYKIIGEAVDVDLPFTK